MRQEEKIVTWAQAQALVNGLQFVGQQGTDYIYKKANILIRVSPLAGGRARMVFTEASCNC